MSVCVRKAWAAVCGELDGMQPETGVWLLRVSLFVFLAEPEPPSIHTHTYTLCFWRKCRGGVGELCVCFSKTVRAGECYRLHIVPTH